MVNVLLLLLIQLAHADGGYSDDGCGSDSSSPSDSSFCCIGALVLMAGIVILARAPAAPKES